MSIRLVLFLAFIARWLVPFFAFALTKDSAIFHSPDTNSYLSLATELLRSGRFASNGLPEIVRTPGYPVFLIPGVLLGHMDFVTIALQIILSCLTVYLVYKTARLLFKNLKVALLCGWAYAIEPLSILYACKLLTETLFTFVLVFGLYVLLKYLKGGPPVFLFLSSVAFSLLTYIRPVSYLLPLLITLILVGWAIAGKEEALRRVCHVLVFLLIAMGLTGIWQFRNKAQTGYSGFSAIKDVTYISIKEQRF